MPVPPPLAMPILLFVTMMLLVVVLVLLVQALAVLAQLLDGEGLPDVLLAARVLDQRGRVAEGGEGEGDVLAGVLVGVVAAHVFFFFLFFFSLSAGFFLPSGCSG